LQSFVVCSSYPGIRFSTPQQGQGGQYAAPSALTNPLAAQAGAPPAVHQPTAGQDAYAGYNPAASPAVAGGAPVMSASAGAPPQATEPAAPAPPPPLPEEYRPLMDGLHAVFESCKAANKPVRLLK
jgi:hypothetical protein